MNRLKEGSTWAGIAAFLASLVPMFPPAAPYLAGAAGIAAAIGGMIPDHGAPK